MAEPGAIQRSKSYNTIDEQMIRISGRIYDAIRNGRMSADEGARRYRAVQNIGNRYLANIMRQPDYQFASRAYSLGRMSAGDAYNLMYDRQYLRRDYMRRRNNR